MSNKTYDIIKKIALLIAPAVVFMTALVDIWGIPYGSQIVATLAALDVFVGVAVEILAANYKKTKNGGGSDG
jgi:hypothetical protein